MWWSSLKLPALDFYKSYIIIYRGNFKNALVLIGCNSNLHTQYSYITVLRLKGQDWGPVFLTTSSVLYLIILKFKCLIFFQDTYSTYMFNSSQLSVLNLTIHFLSLLYTQWRPHHLHQCDSQLCLLSFMQCRFLQTVHRSRPEFSLSPAAVLLS